ncbi:MAG TPA: hypothetical protein VFI29_18125, partial [Hanamia sp.]|nr:hypothetical protein [Hanamia sp.]
MKNANNYFGSSIGSENLWRYSISNFIYTDGVKSMVNNCNAYWLIDLIISHQLHKKVKDESFQVWDLKRVKGNVF